jgi:two-component system, LytTR family, sensor kinase
MLSKPIISPPSDTEMHLSNLENALYTDLAQAAEGIRYLEGIDLSALPKSLQIRVYAAMGFYQNLSGQVVLAEKCYERALQSLDKGDSVVSKSNLLAELAGVQMNLQMYADAEIHLNLAVQHLREHSAPADLAQIQCRRAFLMLHYTRFDQALSFFLASLDTFQGQMDRLTLREASIVVNAWSGLGEVYMRMGDAPKSKETYLKCLEIAEKYDLKARIGSHYLNAGTCFLNENELGEAKRLFQQALVYADHRNVRATANANMGIAYMREEQAQKALPYFDAAEQAYGQPKTTQDFSNLSVLESSRAQVYAHQKQFDKILMHLERAFSFGMKGDNRWHIINVSKQLAHFHSQQGQFRQAYEYLLHSQEISHEYSERLREEKIRELEIRHKAIQKDKEAALAKSELSALQLRSLRAQFNPHFIFNALNGLANLISAHRNDDAEVFLGEFAKLLRLSLELSREEWIPLEKELDFVTKYMSLQKKLRFRGNLLTNIQIAPNISKTNCLIPSMVLQPFIENAIEHGLTKNDGGQIVISFTMEQPKVLTCIIEDDGIGLNASEALNQRNMTKHKSLGMKFTSDRLNMLHELNGVQIQSIALTDLGELTNREKMGTRVVLQVPIQKHK